MLIRISRRFINLIPSVRIARTRNICTWKLRDTTWDVLYAVKFRKGKELKKTSYLIGREYHFFEIKSVLLTNC